MNQADIEDAVRERFGVVPRPAQRALIARTLAGASSLGIMPTGSGKSLAYQASAALLPGTVLVVSPLLSLMRDQVEKLGSALRVARLDATLEREESRSVLQALRTGELDLLYVAPERLANEAFQSALSGARVAALAIDEAHCISAWGHDFRPDYLRLPLLRQALGQPPVLALTATAPPAVQRDIMDDLGIPAEGVVNTGARRPNLALSVEVSSRGSGEGAGGDLYRAREARALEIVQRAPDDPTIVYALRQADTERIAQRFLAAGVRAAAYHAGLEAERRAEVQDRFLADDLACIVATVAFGMGVDKPNVRRIVHVHAPRSLEGYVQEVGRAGRDGAPASAVLLYDEGDLPALGNFVVAKAPCAERVRAALNAAFAPQNRENEETIAFGPQSVGDATHVDPLTVRTLFARLERRGVVRALTPAFDEYRVAIQHDREALESRLDAAELTVWQALLSSGKQGRTWVTCSVAAAAATTGLPHAELRRVLRRVEDEGLAVVQASGALQRYRVLRRPDRDTDLPALLASVQDGLEGEHRRLASVRAYVLERQCRQAHALRYLGDPDNAACGVCDLCRGAPRVEEPALSVPAWQPGFDAQVVRAMAAGAAEPDAAGIAQALCQVSTSRSRPFRRHPAWGRLERAPYAEVLAAVRAALSEPAA